MISKLSEISYWKQTLPSKSNTKFEKGKERDKTHNQKHTIEEDLNTFDRLDDVSEKIISQKTAKKVEGFFEDVLKHTTTKYGFCPDWLLLYHSEVDSGAP